MYLYRHKTPSWIPFIWPHLVWHMDRRKKDIYLSFDDGPHPEITPIILEILSKYCAKVTFFQLGSKVVNHPDLYELCCREGHTVGNHGFEHLDAWLTQPKKFVQNMIKGRDVTKSNLYRPAYGRLPLFSTSRITSSNTLIMWDLLSGDFDSRISPIKCKNLILNHTKNGSIVVLHENEKSKNKVLSILPEILEYFIDKGFAFKAIPPKFTIKTL